MFLSAHKFSIVVNWPCMDEQRMRWDDLQIVSAIVDAGYGARPYDPKTLESQQSREE